MRSMAFAAALAAAMAAAQLEAGSFSLALTGGYSVLALDQAKASLAEAKTSAQSGGAALSDVRDLGGAYFFDLDAMLGIHGGLSLGPRFEWVEAVPGGFSALSGGATLDYSSGGRVLPFMLGLQYEWSTPLEALRLQAAGYAGWALATLADSAKPSGSPEARTSFSGSAPCAEAELAARYRLLPNLSAELGLAYRYAKIDALYADSDESSYFHLKQGDRALDSQGAKLGADFSGLNLKAGMSLDF